MPGGGTRRDNQKGWYAARAVRPVRPRKFRVTSCGTAGVPVLRASDYGLLSIRALTVLTGWAIEWRRLLAIPRQATLCLLKGPGEAGHRRSEEWPITYIFERYLGSPPAPAGAGWSGRHEFQGFAKNAHPWPSPTFADLRVSKKI